jgi:site-specific DNA recombinase
MSLRVALYARVSTPNQTRTQTIEQQLERLQAHVEASGWQLQDKHIFRDDGQSGASLNRPGLDQLRDGLRAGEIDRVLVTEPDRLARNYVHQMILLEELALYGCQIEFLDRPLSEDPQDKLLLQIRSAVAEYERELITDRMRRGRQAKYKAGVLLPWTRPPYGYRLGLENPRDPSQVRIEEAEAAVIKEIFALYVWEGFSLCRLAKQLQQQGIPTPSGKQIWSLSTLRAFLRQPAYTGKVYAHRTQYRAPRIRRSATHIIGTPHGTAEELPPEAWLLVATIPAIITQEEFELAQKRLATNKSFASRNNKSHQYLLRALVSCGVCQAACTAHAREGGKYLYYICSGKAKAIHSRREEKCPSRFAPAQQLDDLVWQDLRELLQHPAHITAALERAHGGAWLPQELQVRRQNLQQAQTHLQQQLDRLTEAYLASVIPLTEYQRRRWTLEEKMAAFALQEKQLDGQVDRQQELVGLASCVEDFCQRIEQGLDNATFEQKRQLVELLVDRVIVADGAVEIRYVIPTSPASEYIRFCHLRSDYRHHIHSPGSPLHLFGRDPGCLQSRGARLASE